MLDGPARQAVHDGMLHVRSGLITFEEVRRAPSSSLLCWALPLSHLALDVGLDASGYRTAVLCILPLAPALRPSRRGWRVGGGALLLLSCALIASIFGKVDVS